MISDKATVPHVEPRVAFRSELEKGSHATWGRHSCLPRRSRNFPRGLRFRSATSGFAAGRQECLPHGRFVHKLSAKECLRRAFGEPDGLGAGFKNPSAGSLPRFFALAMDWLGAPKACRARSFAERKATLRQTETR